MVGLRAPSNRGAAECAEGRGAFTRRARAVLRDGYKPEEVATAKDELVAAAPDRSARRTRKSCARGRAGRTAAQRALRWRGTRSSSRRSARSRRSKSAPRCRRHSPREDDHTCAAGDFAKAGNVAGSPGVTEPSRNDGADRRLATAHKTGRLRTNCEMIHFYRGPAVARVQSAHVGAAVGSAFTKNSPSPRRPSVADAQPRKRRFAAAVVVVQIARNVTTRWPRCAISSCTSASWDRRSRNDR